MGREVGCPWPKYAKCKVTLPDVWLGEHAARRDQAIEEAIEFKSESLTRMAVSLALLDDWENIPGLDGPPEKWEYSKVPLKIMAWLDEVVLADFVADLTVPKVSSRPSGNGQTATETTASLGSS